MSLDAPPQSRASADERRLTAEHALVTARTIDEAAPKILQAVCEALGWEHGALWVVDKAAGVLRCGEIWTTPAGMDTASAG